MRGKIKTPLSLLFQVVVCLLRHLDLMGLPHPAHSRLGGTEFIAWCLRHTIKGMPTGVKNISPAEYDLVPQTALYHTLTQWVVRQIPSLSLSLSGPATRTRATHTCVCVCVCVTQHGAIAPNKPRVIRRTISCFDVSLHTTFH